MHQFGFRPGLDSIYRACFTVFTTFSKWCNGSWRNTSYNVCRCEKGFDTICHLILLGKLDNGRIIGNALLLIQSYLTGWNQFVDGDTVRSVKTQCSGKVGVPQGLILGPLLFLIYVNDLMDAIAGDGLALLFAKDVAISVRGSDESSVREYICCSLMNLL